MTYLAVFDWNSTLLDDMLAVHVATNVCLRTFNVPEITVEHMQDTFTFPLIHFYEKLGVSVDDYLSRAEQEGELFVRSYEEAAIDCKIMHGAFELLQWLNDKDVHCMVLSNHLQPHLDADVERLGINPYMKSISGNAERATITKGLSKQIRLEAYMEEHGFAPEKTFIIGDSHEEPEVARRLGLLGISITGGLLSRERLEKYKAHYIIDRLEEVRPIIEKHWKL